MADDKKKKKPRKSRKDKGKKRGKRIKNPKLQTGSIEFKTIGTSSISAPNITRLAGLVSSSRAVVPYQAPPVDYSSLIQQEFQRYFNQPSMEMVERPDVAQAQEEPNDYELQQQQAVESQARARIAGIRKEEEMATQRAIEATQRADEAESELRQIQPMLVEQVQLLEETQMKNRQEEYKARQYNKKAQYEEIMRKTGTVKDAKKYFDYTGDKEDLNQFRKELFDEAEIAVTRPQKTGERGAPSFKWVFDEPLPEEMGEGYFTQLEMERGQMEDQLGGLHDTVRELMMVKEAREEDIAYYEEEIGRRAKAEEEALGVALSKQEELQQAQQALTEREQQILDLRTTRERQKQVFEEQIQTQQQQAEQRMKELQEGKEKEIMGLTESIKGYQKQVEDTQAVVARLQEDIDYKKQQMTTAVSKQDYDAMKKEVARLDKELKYAREQRNKGDMQIIKQQKEKMALEQALVVAQSPQKGEEKSTEAVSLVRQAMGARIENLRTREERQQEQIVQIEEQFDEERQALRAKIIEAETARDLIAQSALQAEEEYNTEAEWSNNVVGMMAEDLAGQQLRNRQAMIKLQKTNMAILKATLAESRELSQRERQQEIEKEVTQVGLTEEQQQELKSGGGGGAIPSKQRPKASQKKAQEPIPLAQPLPPLAPLQIPSLIPMNPIPPGERVASPVSRIMAGSASPKIIPPREETGGPSQRPILKRSMSQETTESEQEQNWKAVQRQSLELKGFAPASSETYNPRATAFFQSSPKGGSWMRPDPEKAVPSHFATSLIREKVKSSKKGGERVPLQLQPRSQPIFQTSIGQASELQPKIQSELKNPIQVEVDLDIQEIRAEERRPLNLLTYDEMSREQQLQKLEEYKGRMKKYPADVATAQKMLSLDEAIKRKNVQMMQPKIKEELRQKTGIAFETPIEQESPEARAVRERVRERISIQQNPLLQGQPTSL